MTTADGTSNLKLLAAALLAIAQHHPAAAQESGPPLDRSAWQEDFRQLKAGLERSYVNLAWMGSPESRIDVPRLEQRTAEALSHAYTLEEAEKALLDFVAGFRDGHLSPLQRLRTSAIPAAAEPERASLDRDDPRGGCAALGYAATAPVAFTLPFESLPGFVLVGDGMSDPFRSGLAPAPGGRAVGIVRIQEFDANAFPAVCLRGWATLVSAGRPVTPRAVQDAASDAWFAALAETLAALRKRGAVAILVDVGHNSGGGDSGDWIPRMFTGRTVSSAQLRMVDAPVSAGYFDEQIRSMTNGLAAKPLGEGAEALKTARRFFERAKAEIGKRRCDLSWVWRQQRPWNTKACNNLIDAGSAGGFARSLPENAYGNRELASRLSWSVAIEPYFGAWTGPVFVLTDDKTFSAAEMFTATMRDNGIAKTLGVRTGGDGCGFMTNGAPLVLAHTQLRFRVPNCLRLRADNTNEVAGIAPDFPLAPATGESARARAARALALIATDMAEAQKD